jgi:hypothetical protein
MRIHPHRSAVVLVSLWLAGCATLFQGGPSPERIAERGVAALEHHDYDAGMADLAWVSTHFPDTPAGRYALLALAAAELDPANPRGRPEAGVDLLARFRAMENNPPWTMPLANTLRGLVHELRDSEERANVAEREAARAQRSARAAAEQARGAAREAARAEAQRSAMGSRVGALERELALTRHQLAQAREEVERIRRTLGN